MFYELPDLQAAGSLLGDGGFAKRSKLPKRRLEEYDDVRPLLNEEKNILEDNDVSTGVASMGAVAGLEKWMTEMDPGRHILLRASYNGDEVVLKGFIMGEVSQRTGLERELAILSTLRNDCVISPGAVVEDFDMLETTSYVQRVAVFVEYPYYKGTSTSGLLLWKIHSNTRTHKKVFSGVSGFRPYYRECFFGLRIIGRKLHYQTIFCFDNNRP